MASEIKGNDNAMFCRRPVGRGVESWRHPHAWEDLELSSMPNKELSFWQPRVVSAGHPVGGKNHSFHGSRGCLTFCPPILKDLTNYNTIFSSVTCYAQATHRYIYSFFPAFRAPSFLYIIPIYTHIIHTAPSGLDMVAMP